MSQVLEHPHAPALAPQETPRPISAVPTIPGSSLDSTLMAGTRPSQQSFFGLVPSHIPNNASIATGSSNPGPPNGLIPKPPLQPRLPIQSNRPLRLSNPDGRATPVAEPTTPYQPSPPPSLVGLLPPSNAEYAAVAALRTRRLRMPSGPPPRPTDSGRTTPVLDPSPPSPSAAAAASGLRTFPSVDAGLPSHGSRPPSASHYAPGPLSYSLASGQQWASRLGIDATDRRVLVVPKPPPQRQPTGLSQSLVSHADVGARMAEAARAAEAARLMRARTQATSVPEEAPPATLSEGNGRAAADRRAARAGVAVDTAPAERSEAGKPRGGVRGDGGRSRNHSHAHGRPAAGEPRGQPADGALLAAAQAFPLSAARSAPADTDASLVVGPRGVCIPRLPLEAVEDFTVTAPSATAAGAAGAPGDGSWQPLAALGGSGGVAEEIEVQPPAEADDDLMHMLTPSPSGAAACGLGALPRQLGGLSGAEDELSTSVDSTIAPLPFSDSAIITSYLPRPQPGAPRPWQDVDQFQATQPHISTQHSPHGQQGSGSARGAHPHAPAYGAAERRARLPPALSSPPLATGRGTPARPVLHGSGSYSHNSSLSGASHLPSSATSGSTPASSLSASPSAASEGPLSPVRTRPAASPTHPSPGASFAPGSPLGARSPQPKQRRGAHSALGSPVTMGSPRATPRKEVPAVLPCLSPGRERSGGPNGRRDGRDGAASAGARRLAADARVDRHLPVSSSVGPPCTPRGAARGSVIAGPVDFASNVLPGKPTRDGAGAGGGALGLPNSWSGVGQSWATPRPTPKKPSARAEHDVHGPSAHAAAHTQGERRDTTIDTGDARGLAGDEFLVYDIDRTDSPPRGAREHGSASARGLEGGWSARERARGPEGSKSRSVLSGRDDFGTLERPELSRTATDVMRMIDAAVAPCEVEDGSHGEGAAPPLPPPGARGLSEREVLGVAQPRALPPVALSPPAAVSADEHDFDDEAFDEDGDGDAGAQEEYFKVFVTPTIDVQRELWKPSSLPAGDVPDLGHSDDDEDDGSRGFHHRAEGAHTGHAATFTSGARPKLHKPVSAAGAAERQRGPGPGFSAVHAAAGVYGDKAHTRAMPAAGARGGRSGSGGAPGGAQRRVASASQRTGSSHEAARGARADSGRQLYQGVCVLDSSVRVRSREGGAPPRAGNAGPVKPKLSRGGSGAGGQVRISAALSQLPVSALNSTIHFAADNRSSTPPYTPAACVLSHHHPHHPSHAADYDYADLHHRDAAAPVAAPGQPLLLFGECGEVNVSCRSSMEDETVLKPGLRPARAQTVQEGAAAGDTEELVRARRAAPARGGKPEAHRPGSGARMSSRQARSAAGSQGSSMEPDGRDSVRSRRGSRAGLRGGDASAATAGAGAGADADADGACANLGGFFGVYDGHGGSGTARFLKANLHRAFRKHFALELPRGDAVDMTVDPNDYNLALSAARASPPASAANASRLRQALKRVLTGPSAPGGPLAPLTDSAAATVVGRALATTFAEVDRLVLSRPAGRHTGATAQVLYLESRADGRWAHFANCGDAQAVLAVSVDDRKDWNRTRPSLEGLSSDASARMSDEGCETTRRPLAMLVSQIHVASAPAEAQRVRAAGGEVFMGRVSGQLAVSRAFGDAPFKDCGVIVDPFYTCVKLNDRFKFAIIACDGVWDVLTHTEAVECVWGMRDPEAMAQKIVITSLRKGTQDNVSVVVVRLHEYDEGY